MHINWGKVASIGLGIVSAIIPQIHSVEIIARAMPGLTGQSKEDAAVQLAKEAVEAMEVATGRQLVNDPEFDAAARKFIQAYVALQNIVSDKTATTQP